METEIKEEDTLLDESEDVEKEVEEATDKKEINDTNPLDDINNQIESKKEELEELRDSRCFLFLGDIDKDTVDDIYEDLITNYSDFSGKLDVIIDSGGGDINSAFNLAMLFRQYGTEKLTFIIPRWAKSAATLLACGGNEILMTPIAELGPLDPQVTQLNALEKRYENFSPLAIESTLDLIRNEYKCGSKDMADKLIERLQFPLTLGSFKKTLEIGEEYLTTLLSTKMFDENEEEKIRNLAKKVTLGYVDHGFCINLDEAKYIGLKATELKGDELEVVWEIYRLYRERQKIEEDIKSEEMKEVLKEIPPELLDRIQKINPE